MTSAALKKQKPAPRPPPFTSRALAEGMRFNEETKTWVDKGGQSFDEKGKRLPNGHEKDAAEDRAATEKVHGKVPSIPIDWSKLDWSDCDDDGRQRILSTLKLGDVWFHVEGVAVVDDNFGCQTATSAIGAEQLNALFDIGGEGAFQTAEIDGVEYVLFLTPHSR